MDLSDKQDLRWFSEIIRDLRAAAPAHEPLLVGAMARDLLLYYGYDVPIARATTDIDLAFAVAHWDEFTNLRAALIASGAFASAASTGLRLRHRDGRPIDLIPFAGVENAAGLLEWPDGQAEIGIMGYGEALATSVELLLPESQRVAVASLPMLIILKLFAWSERHTRVPGKDASDLFLILGNYLNKDNSGRLYDEAPHLLDSDDFDYATAGAWLAGYDAARSIDSTSPESTTLRDHVLEILSGEVDPGSRLELVGEAGAPAAAALRLLRGFHNGFCAGSSSSK
jgi:predicted nucleotidyltransferase